MTAYADGGHRPAARRRHRLQKQYLADYGLTLGGLVEHHGVDPADFHTIFHDMPLEGVARDLELVAAVAHLPGRRLIFTNADAFHARWRTWG